MTVFDQRDQSVGYQYNAAGHMNFGTTNNKTDFVKKLEELRAETNQAISGGNIDEEAATDIKYNLDKSVQEAKKLQADPSKIKSHLESARTVLQTVKETSSLVAALGVAINTIQSLF